MPPRIVMDTNVLYSALRSRRGCSYDVLLAIRQRRVALVLSQTVLIEYEEILKRNANVLGLSILDVDAILDSLCLLAELYGLSTIWNPILSDPADESFVHLAAESHADYLVTHNIRHFRPATNRGIKVLAPNEFLGILIS